MSETLKVENLLRAPLHLLLLLCLRWWPLVAMKAHVDAQPFLSVKHLAAILADVSAPWFCPVCGAPVLLITVERHSRRKVCENGTLSLITTFFFLKSNPLTTLDEVQEMKMMPQFFRVWCMPLQN